MVIAVVGIGIVGKTLVEHFTHLEYEVLSVERNSSLTLPEAAGKADIVFVVTSPIGEVNELLKLAAENMRPGTLLVHGTSVEAPHGKRTGREQILEKGVALAHLHFHFRPESPLRETLRGQHITLKIEGKEREHWRQWLENQFVPYQPFILELKDDEHESTTTVSQLLHMTEGFITSRIWQQTAPNDLERGLTIAGPPGRFLIRSVLRTASGAKVAAEILEGHPQTLDVLAMIRQAVRDLGDLVRTGDIEGIEAELSLTRTLIPRDMLKVLEARTLQLIRLEADLQRHNVVLNFSAEENQVGLLAWVLGEFDARGVDKTTTIAQTNPDGSCTFVIGVREHTPAVDEAMAAIESWRKE